MTARRAQDLARAIEEIEALDRPGCLDRWRAAFGRPPPKHLSLSFMQRVLLWELQERLLGRLSRKTERALARIASGKAAPVAAKPGAQLVREWNGRTWQVEVGEGSYVMDGKRWRSLSAIARHITGAHWSGPRFFGVQGGTAKVRGSRQRAKRSLLIGKLFDETADRLTPKPQPEERQTPALLFLPAAGDRSQPQAPGRLAASCRTGGACWLNWWGGI